VRIFLPRPLNLLIFKSNRAEAAIALRQRLNETVEQFDDLRKEHTELTIKYEVQDRQLTIAKSDRELDSIQDDEQMNEHTPQSTLSTKINLIYLPR
jgi:hypothetical protein